MNSRFLITAAVACTASSLFAQEKPSVPPAVSVPSPKWQKVLPSTPPGVTMSEVTIAEYPEHNVTLVIYMPEKPGRYPAILDIHGGGWKARQIDSDRPMMERLATRGFVTALVSYRLSTEAKYPAALHDCKSAIRWLRANAAKHQIDPTRLGVMGGSAGGHLSALTAMTGGVSELEGTGPFPKESTIVQACLVMAATQDFTTSETMQKNQSVIAFLGATIAEKPELYREASPITHVRAGVPPTIFIEGEKDTLKIGRAEMQEKLRKLGIATDLHTLKDAPHPFWMSQPWLDETVEIASAFFKQHLGEPAPAR